MQYIGHESLARHENLEEWMEEVRKNNSYVKIVPRVLFDDWSPDHINQFIQHEAWMNRCLGDLINLLTRSNFDGAVIEFWSKVMIHTRGEAVNLLVEMMNSWGSTFHKRNMQFILAVGPALNPKNQITKMLTTSHLYALAENVDYIQMMTYDFPSTSPSGVAPYDWVEQNVKSLLDRAPPDLAIHLMLGLNHYGYEYTSDGMQAINFDQYLKKLRQADNKLEWDANAKEHVLVTFDSKIYYPSLTSVEMRLNIARKYGVGVGIWDFGQGLNYFTQLL
ncbi:unnamed protein product [Angiostrongylus costaricensis]|uniref:Chitinase domain-containing protein 1 n=1 Tax=Angiostrongylus costaricensis TaxID=334426 RepID=A0A158PDW1_ANGCS|nr:unnamed protein product [Angiostrongylus costaricensis]